MNGSKRGLYLYLQRIAREGFPSGEEGEDLIGDAHFGLYSLKLPCILCDSFYLLDASSTNQFLDCTKCLISLAGGEEQNCTH